MFILYVREVFIISKVIRYSTVNDIEGIAKLIKESFGSFDYNDLFSNVEGRYLLYIKDNKILAMTGLRKDLERDGLEIDWTCTLPEYRNKGIMKELFCSLFEDRYEDTFCSALRIPSCDNYFTKLLKEFGFVKIKDNVKCNLTLMGETSYSCRKTCPHWNNVKCICYEDLYRRIFK